MSSLASTVYLGEAAGGRIFRLGIGTTDAAPTGGAGGAVGLDLWTWDHQPGGATGRVVWRQLDFVHRCANGATWALTPVVDDVEQATQVVTRTGSGQFTESIAVACRGTRLSLKAVCTSRPGDVEVLDVQAHFAILRTSP